MPPPRRFDAGRPARCRGRKEKRGGGLQRDYSRAQRERERDNAHQDAGTFQEAQAARFVWSHFSKRQSGSGASILFFARCGLRVSHRRSTRGPWTRGSRRARAQSTAQICSCRTRRRATRPATRPASRPARRPSWRPSPRGSRPAGRGPGALRGPSRARAGRGRRRLGTRGAVKDTRVSEQARGCQKRVDGADGRKAFKLPRGAYTRDAVGKTGRF